MLLPLVCSILLDPGSHWSPQIAETVTLELKSLSPSICDPQELNELAIPLEPLAHARSVQTQVVLKDRLDYEKSTWVAFVAGESIGSTTSSEDIVPFLCTVHTSHASVFMFFTLHSWLKTWHSVKGVVRIKSSSPSCHAVFVRSLHTPLTDRNIVALTSFNYIFLCTAEHNTLRDDTGRLHEMRGGALLPPKRLSQVMSPTWSTFLAGLRGHIDAIFRDTQRSPNSSIATSDGQCRGSNFSRWRAPEERICFTTANAVESCKNRPDSHSSLKRREFVAKCTVDFSKNVETQFLRQMNRRVQSSVGGWNVHVSSSSSKRTNPGRCKIGDPKIRRES